MQWGWGGRACSEARSAAPGAAPAAASSAAPAEAAAAAAAPAAATATTKAAPTLAAAAAPALAAAAMAFAATATAFAALAAAAALATAVRRGEDLLWWRRRLAPLVLLDTPLLSLDRAVVVGAPVPLGDARRGAAVLVLVRLRRLRAGCCGHVRVAPLGTVTVALVRHLLALALLPAVVNVLPEPPRRRSRRLLLLLRRRPGAHRHGHVGLVRGGEAALRVSQRRARQTSR